MWTTRAYSQSNGRTIVLERLSTTNGGSDRAGSTGAVLGHSVLVPSTIGVFLRSFTWGHARQLDRVAAEILARAAHALAAAPLEFDALDLAWRGGRGGLLARCSGTDPSRRARRALELMRDAGLEQLGINVIRGCTPWEDKVKVRLNRGVNRLLLKVTQGAGEWSACCRLRTPDGAPLDGVTVGVGEE